MSKELIEKLRALHVWPQIVADTYAETLSPRHMKGLYEVGRIAHEVADALSSAAGTPEPGAVAPEGWKLVPMEPTREMWAAMADTLYGYKNRHHDKVAGDLYYAMLAAAPTPPHTGGEE